MSKNEAWYTEDSRAASVCVTCAASFSCVIMEKAGSKR